MKAGLLHLVDHAADQGGWSARRACALVGLDHWRAARWQARRAAGCLDDLPPGGHPLHGLLAWERTAIVELFEAWGEVGRSHRKLAHRGSRAGLVHVSESTVARVLAAEGLALPGNPSREPVPRTPWPDWLEWKPSRVWAYDFTHWSRARRASIAILDVVSRKWLATLTSAEESSTRPWLGISDRDWFINSDTPQPHARPASNTVGTHPRRTSDHEPPVAGYFTAALAQKVRRTSAIRVKLWWRDVVEEPARLVVGDDVCRAVPCEGVGVRLGAQRNETSA